MKILFIFYLVMSLSVASYAQSSESRVDDSLLREAIKLGANRVNWKYFKLTEIQQGVVVKQNKGCCCYINIATTTFVKTSTGDTIRVISACLTEPVAKGDPVLIKPLNKVTVSRNGTTDLDYDRTVMKTTYAEVKKLH